MTSTLRGAGGGRVNKKCDVIGRGGGGGVSECYGRPILTFLLKKIGFAPCSEIMLSQTLILLTRNLLFDSDVRQ